MKAERLYERSVRALSAAMVCIGLALVVLTLAAGGGALSTGFLLGLVFVAVGIARLYLAHRMRR